MLDNITLILRYQIGKKQLIKKIILTKSNWKTIHFDIELVKIQLEKGIKFKIDIYPKSSLQFTQISLIIPYLFHTDDAIFCNGFQSWTETRTFSINEQIGAVKHFAAKYMEQYGDYWILKNMRLRGLQKKLHSWTLGYVLPKFVGNQKNGLVEENQAPILFIGSLDEQSAYTLIQYDTANEQIHLYKDYGTGEKSQKFTAFDVFMSQDKEKKVFKNYFYLLKLNKISRTPAVGWTSWYHYYTNISQDIILNNLKAFMERNLPIDIFQIDDGWQHAIGDWVVVKRNKFPKGLRFLSEQIQTANYKAGLWLAPFICEKKSVVFKQHPEWLLKDKDGELVNAGYNVGWQSPIYVLDFYHPEVRKYLQKAFDIVLNTWGFDMVKLDFLYAVAMSPPPNKTRGQVMYEAMLWLRTIVGDKIILGCGVPLGSAFGLVDYCRIGADVHLGWDVMILKYLGSRERASTILTLQNTIARHRLDGVAFWNDPDVSILRNKKTWLTKEQKYTLFLVNQLFGSLQFVSDYLGDYDEAQMHLYQSQFPFRRKDIELVKKDQDLYETHFAIGNLQYVAFINLSKKSKELTKRITQITTTPMQLLFSNRDRTWLAHPSFLETFPYFKKDALGEKFSLLQSTFTLEAYSSVCFLKIDAQQEHALAGSTGHLFPASELTRWEVNKTNEATFTISLSEQVRNHTEVWFWDQANQAIVMHPIN